MQWLHPWIGFGCLRWGQLGVVLPHVTTWQWRDWPVLVDSGHFVVWPETHRFSFLRNPSTEGFIIRYREFITCCMSLSVVSLCLLLLNEAVHHEFGYDAVYVIRQIISGPSMIFPNFPSQWIFKTAQDVTWLDSSTGKASVKSFSLEHFSHSWRSGSHRKVFGKSCVFVQGIDWSNEVLMIVAQASIV